MRCDLQPSASGGLSRKPQLGSTGLSSASGTALGRTRRRAGPPKSGAGAGGQGIASTVRACDSSKRPDFMGLLESDRRSVAVLKSVKSPFLVARPGAPGARSRVGVPHPVSWTHVCATRHGVARIARALRVACDTPAFRGASTGCSVRRTQRRRRARRRGCERPGRRSLAP